MKIAIMESLAVSDQKLAELKKPFEEAGHTFVEYEKSTDVPTLIAEAKDADVMVIANMPMPAEVIRACENLKFIDVAFTGVDHVGLDAAKEKNVAVSNASGYSNEAVAELVLGMALSLSRNLTAVERRCRDGATKDGLVGWELKGKTVGIIGLGRIGTRTAELFTLHCPLIDSTRGLIDAAKLAKMKKRAVLINCARGPVVVTQDLADALDNGVIAGAGIDVFDKEPPLDKTEPLLNCKNCLVTPHVAFASKESMVLRAEIVFDNLASWIKGEQKNIVL